MKNYKIITTPTTTRYILESATSGATSAGNVASSEQPMGSIITREGDKNKNKVPQKPRQGPLRPQTGGGKHKDKKRAEKQGDVKHKKPFMEDHEVSMASNELKSIHANAKKLLALVQQYGEQGDLEAWQQSKITKAADYLNSVLQSIGGEQDALDELKGDPNKPDPKKVSHFQNLLKTQKDRFAQQGFARAADDTDKLQKKYREPISELDKPSGTLYIILLRDRSESVRVIGDFGTFPAEVQARASKVGLKDKEGRKERPLKVNFLMTSASQALAELDKALADVDFIGGEKAEFVFKNSAFETDIEDEVKELADLIQSGADERFKNYEEPEVGNEPDPKPKGVDHFVVGPDGKRRRVPIPGKPDRQLGGHAVQQPKTYTYKLQRTDLAPKLRDMGFKFDGNSIILSKQQRDQLLAKMGDKQFGMIFGQGDRFAEAGNERNKRNPTRDFLRRYPVPPDQMVKPVKKPEKKKPEQGVAEGSDEGKTQKYEMMLSNGKVKRFTAKDDADAKRIAAGHGAKSVIRLRGGVPAGKVAEGERKLGPAPGQSTPNQAERAKSRDHQRTDAAKKARDASQRKGLKQDKDGTYYAKEGVAEGSDKLQGTPVVSLKDLDSKDTKKNKYGQTVPKKLKKDDPRVKFHKDEKQGVAEGSGKNVVKSVKVGNFRHDLVDTGMGWQVRIYNGDELYDTGLSKNSEQKGLAALEDAVAYTEKQTRTKRQGVAEGSLETDNMVSHIGQVIQSIYPRGGDKNTYMKLVAQEMPRIVRADPKLFRRAFGMAYDRFFHIDQDDDFDYTDYSMRQGERGMEEEKQKGVDGKACWKGYKRMGTKKKGGRTVDNCVPVGEDAYMESLWSQLDEYKFTSLPYKGQKKEKQAPFALGSKHIGKAGGSSKSKGALSGMKASTSKDSNKPVVSTEAAPPGDKYERMVKHIKKGYAKDGKITDKERSIAYATAWKAKNKAKK